MNNLGGCLMVRKKQNEKGRKERDEMEEMDETQEYQPANMPG